MRPRTAAGPSVRTLVQLFVAAFLAALVPTVAAGALERHLPPEDRRALALAAIDADEELRLFDLLPAEDPDEDVDVREEEVAEDEPAMDVIYVLAVGETLADVAALHGIEGDDGWRRLFDANTGIADPDLVEVGMRIRVPGDDEELAARDLPVPPRPTGATSRGGGAGVWDRLAACEAGGNWAANSGNGYYGGLQFSAGSWRAAGGTGLPHEHGRATQIAMGERLRAAQGWGAWPSCSRRLGLR
jgi:hypothetical protein